MNALLDSQSLKTFARLVRFLAKVGNEFYFEAKKEGLFLKTLNNGITSICTITFNPYFFSQYNIGKDPDENICRISSRPILLAVRNVNTVVNCRIRFDKSKDQICFDLVKPKGLQTQYTVKILENEDIENPDFDNTNMIICHPAILSNLLTNIPKDCRELSFDLQKDGMEIRNHINHPDKDVQTVRLKFQLDKSEFTTYDVVQDTRLIINSQDFLSIIELAETTTNELKISFSDNGKPLVVSIENDTCLKVELILATMKEDTLQKLRKPAKVTSYKELMGSYIESRISSHVSDSEVNRNGSPRVDTFGSSAVKKSSTEPNLRKPKRKSIDMETDSSHMDTDVSHVEDNGGKKAKSSHNLSVREQEEVADVMARFANYTEEDELDDVYRNEPVAHGSANILAGLNVRVQRDTVVATPSDTEESRYQGANLQSELIEIADIPKRRPTTTGSFSKQYGEKQQFVKRVFGPMFENKKTNLSGPLLCPNSDSEESGNENVIEIDSS